MTTQQAKPSSTVQAESTGVMHSLVTLLRKSELGATAMEFALILPLLFTMTLGVVELGYMYFASATAEKAAQVGARAAVTGKGHDDGTRLGHIQQAIDEFTAPWANKASISYTISSFPPDTPGAIQTGAGSPCDIVEVKVQLRYSPLTPLVGDLFAPEISVQGTERMVNEPWLMCG